MVSPSDHVLPWSGLSNGPSQTPKSRRDNQGNGAQMMNMMQHVMGWWIARRTARGVQGPGRHPAAGRRVPHGHHHGVDDVGWGGVLAPQELVLHTLPQPVSPPAVRNGRRR